MTSLSPAKLREVCDAYQRGFDKGIESGPDRNPFVSNTDEYDAWMRGYEIGLQKRPSVVQPTGGDYKVYLTDISGEDPDILICKTSLGEAEYVRTELIATFRQLAIFNVGAIKIMRGETIVSCAVVTE
jgi:hypothetical protein